MGNREDLDAILCSTIGSEFVYFQPPESLKIQYPCVVYSLASFYEPKADNMTYHRKRVYDMVYITKDPDDPMIETLADLQFCSMKKPYTADNLHHYPYTIYY